MRHGLLAAPNVGRVCLLKLWAGPAPAPSRLPAGFRSRTRGRAAFVVFPPKGRVAGMS